MISLLRDIFEYIVDLVAYFLNWIVLTFKSLMFLGHTVQFPMHYLFLIPSGLMVFCSIFMVIYIFNRITGGKN